MFHLAVELSIEKRHEKIHVYIDYFNYTSRTYAAKFFWFSSSISSAYIFSHVKIHCEEEPSEFAESSDFSVDLSTLINVSDEEGTESSARSDPLMENETNVDRDDKYERSKLSSINVPDSNYSNSTSVEYEDIESIESSCQSRRYTYQPKGLNNIYNEYTRVVNNGSFIQSINIEQCL